MSKKRFTEGLESLFDDLAKERADRAERKPARRRRKSEAEQEGQKRSSGKDFSSDLDSFLKEAFEESFEEQVRQKARPGKESGGPPLTGLDALIRNTLEPASVRIDPKATRRLVVTFREEQLDKLRHIAREEKTRLKKVIHQIVEGYLQEYEEKKDEMK